MGELFTELTNPFTGLPGADRAALAGLVARVRSAREVCDRFEHTHPDYDRRARAFYMTGVLEFVLEAVRPPMLGPEAAATPSGGA